MYNAKQNYLSSYTQKQIVELNYQPKINANLGFTRSITKTKIPNAICEEYYDQIIKFQQIYPCFNIEQVFLAPLGGKLIMTGGIQTYAIGISEFSFQTQPSFGIAFQQPLSSSAIDAGHADIKQANMSFQQATMEYQLICEQLVLSVIDAYFQL